MDAVRYHGRTLADAWRRTSFLSRDKIVPMILAAIMSGGWDYYIGAGTSVAIVWGSIKGVLVYAVICVLAFAWNLLLAPSRMDKDSEKEAKAKADQIAALTSRRETADTLGIYLTQGNLLLAQVVRSDDELVSWRCDVDAWSRKRRRLLPTKFRWRKWRCLRICRDGPPDISTGISTKSTMTPKAL